MGLVDKAAFVGGELDPALWERTNLDKYRNGLANARNVVVSRTGSLISRQGRGFLAQTKLLNSSVICFSPKGSGVVLEIGVGYIRVYSLITFKLIGDIAAASIVEADLPNLHFESSGSFVYIFCAGKHILKFNYSNGTFIDPNFMFSVPGAPLQITVTPSTGTPPTGYSIQYAITYVINGEEGGYIESGVFGQPLDAGEDNSILGNLGPIALQGLVTQMNVYKRPYLGGAYGFCGSTTSFSSIGGGTELAATYTDLGGDADFTHQPPLPVTPYNATAQSSDPGLLLSNTGIIYQQSLLITDAVTDLEAIYKSRPGFQNDFTQNFPLDDASALKFKAGTSGYARVYRMLDSDGLVAFTEAGVFLNQGALGPDNLALDKKGNWVINGSLPPLPVPGGVLFVDRATNGVRNLQWSLQVNSYTAAEVSLYSNHLFRTRQISTWHFQEGVLPLLWVVFNDGTSASFTFEFEEQMQAWTRHDSALQIRSSAGTTNADQSFFVVSKTDVNGNVTRYIEVTIPRYVQQIILATDPDSADKGVSNAYMDSITTFRTLLNDSLKTGDTLQVSTQTNNVDGTPNWCGPLNMFCQSSALFPALGAGKVGAVLRFFDENRTAIDLQVLSRTDDNNITVQVYNIDKFPSQWATKLRPYLCQTVLTGLGYMEGEFPSVVVDGATYCSPNNDVDGYPELQVVNGTLTLLDPGAIIHVGRPIVADVETLDIDTVEQAPTLVESIVVNKVYVKTNLSRGLFIGNKFPNGNSVSGMTSIDQYDVDYSQSPSIIGNRAPQPMTKRYEVSIPGDWSSQGKIFARQVDPIHFEILSFIPDVEVLTRSDR